MRAVAYFLGIDGGGTKTTCVLGDENTRAGVGDGWRQQHRAPGPERGPRGLGERSAQGLPGSCHQTRAARLHLRRHCRSGAGRDTTAAGGNSGEGVAGADRGGRRHGDCARGRSGGRSRNCGDRGDGLHCLRASPVGPHRAGRRVGLCHLGRRLGPLDRRAGGSRGNPGARRRQLHENERPHTETVERWFV